MERGGKEGLFTYLIFGKRESMFCCEADRYQVTTKGEKSPKSELRRVNKKGNLIFLEKGDIQLLDLKE